MQFGISPCLPDLSHVEQRERLFDEIIAEAQVAEQAGFDSCLMTEHHQHSHGSFPSPCWSPRVLLPRPPASGWDQGYFCCRCTIQSAWLRTAP
jgi:hypothetical protein